jgi:hypothetical protein
MFGKFKHIVIFLAQGQEVEFHEIEIQLFQEVKFSIMRLKSLIIIQSPDYSIFHEIEIP